MFPSAKKASIYKDSRAKLYNKMRNKSLLVFGKEIKVMVRDRRTIIGVVVVSLVVMPFLMGFIGNIDRLTGSNDTSIRVLLEREDDVLLQALSNQTGIELLRASDLIGTSDKPHLVIRKEGETYKIYRDSTERQLGQVARNIQNAIEDLREKLVLERLAAKGISASELKPFKVETVDTADAERRAGALLGMLVPYIAIILLVTSAIRSLYIAVGEKEKNTLASLLVSNVPRYSIVLGKTLAIMVFAIVSSILLILGMIVMANLGFSIGITSTDVSYYLSFIQIMALVVSLLSLSLLISAIIMLLGSYARSSREAGVYTSPLIFISIFLAVFSFSTTDFGHAVYAVPILGNALAMKDTFLNSLSGFHLILSVATNLLIFLLLVSLSVRIYSRETVLFRE